MAKKITLSKRASIKLDQLLKRLQKEWSIKVKNEFIDTLDRSVEIIAENPKAFPESNSQKAFTNALSQSKQPSITE